MKKTQRKDRCNTANENGVKNEKYGMVKKKENLTPLHLSKPDFTKLTHSLQIIQPQQIKQGSAIVST